MKLIIDGHTWRPEMSIRVFPPSLSRQLHVALIGIYWVQASHKFTQLDIWLLRSHSQPFCTDADLETVTIFRSNLPCRSSLKIVNAFTASHTSVDCLNEKLWLSCFSSINDQIIQHSGEIRWRNHFVSQSIGESLGGSGGYLFRTSSWRINPLWLTLPGLHTCCCPLNEIPSVALNRPQMALKLNRLKTSQLDFNLFPWMRHFGFSCRWLGQITTVLPVNESVLKKWLLFSQGMK